MVAVSLIKGDKMASGAVDYRDALPVNMYGVPKNIFGAVGYMLQMYGLTKLGDGIGIDRAAIWVYAAGLEGHYRVSGNSLISVSVDGINSILGTIEGSEECSITYSFNNVIVVGNGQLFYYNPTDGFRVITSELVVGKPTDVAWIDGYVFLTDGKDIYHSNVLNEELFEAQASSDPQFLPDKVMGISHNKNNELVVFGEISTQHYINTGAENFAFQNLPSKTSKLGILGAHCKAELGGIYYILGRRNTEAPSCHAYSLGSAQKIASREIEIEIASYTPNELATTTIDAFTNDDVSLIIYHFPRSTFMYNATIAKTVGIENAWSEIKTGIKGTSSYPAKNIIIDPRSGLWLCGDKTNSNIGILNDKVATHYGDIAEWKLFTAFIKAETMSIDVLEIEIVPGITAPENDATVFVSRTNDGRVHSQEFSEEYGATNDYNKRFYITRLGYIRDWVGFRLRGASRSRMAFSLMNVDIK